MARLFISHSSRDNVAAIAVRSWLVANGWSRDNIFLDLHHIGAGERWRDTLRKANASCEAIVFLASPDSIGSIECQKELELAEALGKEIIPVILRDLKKDDPRLARYSERQFADLSVEPRQRMDPVVHDGQVHHLDLNWQALHAISSRLSALGVAPGSFLWPSKGISNPAPYPGLAAFDEADAGIFFGRDTEIMSALTEIRLVRRRRAPRLIVIEAASGAGKSSFLRAGLWPRLARDPEFAPLAILRPAQGILSGPDGLGRRLAPLFADHGKPRTPGHIYAPLLSGDRAGALADVLAEAVTLVTQTRRATNPEARTAAPILAIDQGEELFATENEAEGRRFLALLAKVLEDPPEDLDLYVLITIRADSVQSLLARVAELGLETPKPLYLPPLSKAAYRDVILGPARVYSAALQRLTIEPALADALVEEARGADALPLLAFTLGRLFVDYGTGGEMMLAHYLAMGGIAGSIGRALEDAKVRTGAAGTADNLRRLLLPQLATWGPNADQLRGTAKRLVAPIARVLGGDNSDLAPLANALVESRLLTRQSDTLEVAHEALLRQPPISDWLGEDREFLVWRDRIARERTSFDGNHRSLLAGRELQIAQGWLNARAYSDIADRDRSFIEESVAEDERRRSEADGRERQRQAAELQAAQAREHAAQESAAAARRIARRTAAGLVVALVLAVSAGVAGLYAYWQRQDAQLYASEAIAQRDIAKKQTEIAEQGKRESERIKEQAQRTEAGLLARAANSLTHSFDGGAATLVSLEALPDVRAGVKRPYISSAEIELDWAQRVLRERATLGRHLDEITSAKFSNDGRLVVTTSRDRTAILWDAESGKELIVMRGHESRITGASFSDDGRFIVTSSGDRTARLWATETGKELMVFRGHTGPLTSAKFNSDGHRIVTASSDRTARLWDARTGKQLVAFNGHGQLVSGASVSVDGRRVLTSSFDMTARLWDAETGQEHLVLKGHTFVLESASFSGDGRRILTVALDRTARLWDAESGAELLTITSHHERGFATASFSSGGGRLVTASADEARVWDSETGKELAVLTGHQNTIRDASFSADARFVVTASDDKTARIWDAGTGRELAVLRGHQGAATGASFSKDGRSILTSSDDKTARLWATEAQLEEVAYSGTSHSVVRAAFSDRAHVFVIYMDGSYRVRSVESGKDLAALQVKGRSDKGVSISDNGRYIAIASVEKQVHVWDVSTGKQVAGLRGDHARVLALSDDGGKVITESDDRAVRLWDVNKGAELTAFSESLRRVSLSPDGRRMVTIHSEGGEIVLWDATTGKKLASLQGHEDFVSSAAFSSDGRIVTASSDKTLRMWDGNTGKQIMVLRHDQELKRAAFDKDGTRIIAMASHAVWVWDPRAGTSVQVLSSDERSLEDAQISRDGRRIIAYSSDGTVQLWDAHTGEAVAVLRPRYENRVRPLFDNQMAASLSVDGRRAFTVANDTVIVWKLRRDTQELIDSAKARLQRCLTQAQRKLYSLPETPPLWCVERQLWPYHTNDWQVWLAAHKAGKEVLLPKQ